MPIGIPVPPLNYWLIVVLVTLATNALKPFIEQLPFSRPNTPTHDNTIRAVNFVLNLAAIIGFAWYDNLLNWQQLPAYLVAAFVLTGGGHLVYRGVNWSPASGTPMSTSTGNPIAQVDPAILDAAVAQAMAGLNAPHNLPASAPVSPVSEVAPVTPPATSGIGV
jgi:hypothetical protein